LISDKTQTEVSYDRFIEIREVLKITKSLLEIAICDKVQLESDKVENFEEEMQ